MRSWQRISTLLLICLVSLIFCLVGADDLVTAQGVGKVVKVEVAVPPKANSIKTSLTADPPRPVVNQGQTITYTFSYQSTNSSPVPVTLQAYWGLGTTHGLGEDDIQGLMYQVGSATQGYGGALPVVDLDARTITWQIEALPTTTEPQTVEFRLQLSDGYQGAGLVTFPIEGRIISIAGAPVVRKSVGYVYEPTVSKAKAELLSKVDVLAVNDVSARVGVSVNNELAHVDLKYGSELSNLNQTALRTNSGQENSFLLPNLLPQNTTYFQITAETSEQSITSDIFNFSTAAQPSRAVLKPWLLTIAQKNRVLRTGKIDGLKADVMSDPSVNHILKIEQKEEIDVALNLADSADLESVDILLKGPETVGLNLAEITPGMFANKIRLPTTLGRYEVVSRIADAYGNVAETKLQEIDIRPALKISDSRTGKPLPRAEVTLLAKNEVTGGFEIVTDIGMVEANPSRSDSHGLVPISRQAGFYRIDVLAPGYQPAHREFELDIEGIKEFPQIELQTAGNYWFGRLRYYLHVWK